MDKKEREFMRNALLCGEELPADLGERFGRQIEDLLRPRLSKAARIACAVLAVFDLLAAPVFAYGSYSIASAGDMGSLLRLFMTLCLGIGAAVLLGTSAAMAYMSWSGRNPGTQLRIAAAGIGLAFVLIFMVVMFAKLPDFDLPPNTMISVASALIFYWTMALGLFLYDLLRWERRGILIEQKRLQLEIALLREQLAKKL